MHMYNHFVFAQLFMLFAFFYNRNLLFTVYCVYCFREFENQLWKEKRKEKQEFKYVNSDFTILHDNKYRR